MGKNLSDILHLNDKKTVAILLPVVVVVIMVLMVFCGNGDSKLTYHKNSGLIFGTSYNITYQSDTDYQEAIKAVLDSIDYALSPFNKASIITAVNNNKDVSVNDDFIKVFTLAKEVSEATSGTFDITVAPLVNAWGFGFKNGTFPTNKETDSIKAFVGMDKVRLNGRKIVKDDPRIMLDCSAIAKGYAVDKVANMLKEKGVQNFLVEIGGEIVAAGVNAHNKAWSIGVTKPEDDSLSVNSEVQMVMTISDCAIATSGNYRNYYIKDGHKYAHTIDPTTGKPAESNLLSATVTARSCAEADAYATAFMVMGKEKALELLKQQKDKQYILIYDNNGKTEWVVSRELNISK
jgi:thiamine biosynthesis lipoprotein